MKRALLLVLISLLGVAPARAQSLFGARGLGLPVAPVDARARALGGIGVGLPGLNTSMVNPAELGGITRKGISVVLQPSATDITVGGNTDNVSGTRFPLMQVMLPLSQRLVVSFGYGASYDQFWAIELADTVAIGASQVPVNDVVRSDGGVGQARLSAALALSDRFAIGAAVGLHTGSLERSVTRTFGDSTQYNPFQTQIRWDYSGVVGAVGARWDPDPALRLAASATFGGDIEAEGKAGDAIDRTFAAPLRVAFGASGFLGRELIASVGGEWTRGDDQSPPAQDDVLPLAGADQAWRFGGGLEWTGSPTAARAFPLRIGGSYTDLPYHLDVEEAAREWSVSGGLGLRMSDNAREPFALADIAVERGGRSGLGTAVADSGIEESFWRVTISLSLFGR